MQSNGMRAAQRWSPKSTAGPADTAAACRATARKQLKGKAEKAQQATGTALERPQRVTRQQVRNSRGYNVGGEGGARPLLTTNSTGKVSSGAATTHHIQEPGAIHQV
eukprot:349608-Chlamydomonas_euryale.AAC.5